MLRGLGREASCGWWPVCKWFLFMRVLLQRAHVFPRVFPDESSLHFSSVSVFGLVRELLKKHRFNTRDIKSNRTSTVLRVISSCCVSSSFCSSLWWWRVYSSLLIALPLSSGTPSSSSFAVELRVILVLFVFLFVVVTVARTISSSSSTLAIIFYSHGCCVGC